MTRARRVLVTGGARGIGAAIVERLAGQGFAVEFTYHQANDTAAALSERLGAAAQGQACDLADGEAVESLARSLEAADAFWGLVQIGVALGAIWLEKAHHLRQRGGMTLVLTHPDYADDARLLDGYRTLLRTFADDPSAWRALPREVSSWWRRRAASSVEPEGESWVIRGPAAEEGRILLADPGVPVASPVGGAP